jgi:hypothetical protein
MLFTKMKNPKQLNEASDSNVLHSGAKATGAKSRKTFMVSGRVSRETKDKIPPCGLGKYVERSFKRKKGVYDEEVALYAASCVVRLDRLAYQVAKKFPDDPSTSMGDRLDRLTALAEFTAEIASLSGKMEDLFDGI